MSFQLFLMSLHLPVKPDNPDYPDNSNYFDNFSSFTGLDQPCELSCVRVFILSLELLPNPPYVRNNRHCAHKVNPKEEFQEIPIDHDRLKYHLRSKDDHAENRHAIREEIVLFADSEHLDVWKEQLIHDQY